MKRFGIIAVAVLLLATAGTAAAAPGLRGRLDALVAGDAAHPAAAIAAVAELRRGAQAVRAASGTTELGGTRPAPVAARFRVGSVTKTFTATLVLQLVAEHRLALSDPLDRWLPELAVPGGAAITVRDLLRHTSGLPEYAGPLLNADGTPKEPLRTWPPAELMRLSTGMLTGPAVPGTFAYSNTNYIALGMIVSRVTGHPYAAELRRRVLDPLGLRDTTAPGTFPYLTGPHAHGYVPVQRDGELTGIDVTTVNPTLFGDAGSIISSTADLNRFFHALLTGRLLPPSLLTAMKTPNGESGYGFGLEVATLSCGLVYGHGGGVPGYATLAFERADGTRQLSLSATRWAGYDGDRLHEFLEWAMCG